jgi:hypothetical protein
VISLARLSICSNLAFACTALVPLAFDVQRVIKYDDWVNRAAMRRETLSALLMTGIVEIG